MGMSRYPTRFIDIDTWGDEDGVSREEASRRFIQYVILAAFSQSRTLRESLVFKGGNALDFVWQPNRSTLDLDFSIVHEDVLFDINEDGIRRHVGRAVEAFQQRAGVLMRVQSVRQRPPGPNRAFPTFLVRVGYALPDQVALQRRMQDGRMSPHVVDIEISANEAIGAFVPVRIGDVSPPLRVSTIEDIVAEKLRALLQQPIRNRQRRQDVLDIAVLLRLHPKIDRSRVSQFLVLKCEARDIDPRKSSFHDPEIRSRAHVDYDALQSTTRVLFIPFEEAWGAILSLVDELAILD
jgi:predicted nucleotidyltransferase component of viral defense system